MSPGDENIFPAGKGSVGFHFQSKLVARYVLSHAGAFHRVACLFDRPENGVDGYVPYGIVELELSVALLVLFDGVVAAAARNVKFHVERSALLQRADVQIGVQQQILFL